MCSLTCTAPQIEIYNTVMEILYERTLYQIPTLSPLTIKHGYSRATWQNLTNFQNKTAQRSNHYQNTL